MEALGQAAGGHIKLYSEPGLGTTVHIYLPVAPDDGVSASDSSTVQPLPTGDVITDLALPDFVESLLTDYAIDVSQLTFEVTEDTLMTELPPLDILTRLRMKGINLSIDDFGTGFSSLVQLQRVPFSETKIDRSFVMKMRTSDEARAIVETTILPGHKLGMQVAAEGVEDRETLQEWRRMGCDIAQGFHIARPMPADELPAWWADWQTRN